MRAKASPSFVTLWSNVVGCPMVLLMSEPASSHQLRAGEEAKSVLQEGQDLEGRTLPAQNLSGFNWIFFPMHNKNSFVCSKDGI